jgi:exonuclease III
MPARTLIVFQDLTNAKKNWNKTAGYTEAETTSFKNILNPPDGVEGGKFVDIWRKLHPENKHYTYFSYRFNCRQKGIGWRLDMCRSIPFLPDKSKINLIPQLQVVVSERLADRIKMVCISITS